MKFLLMRQPDIFALYDLAHDHYQQHGGVNPGSWINLYDSFHQQKIDVNFDLEHPGIESNQTYFQTVKNRLQELGVVQ